MINLPIDFAARYIAFLSANCIKRSQHRFYLKWLRYYLDFCTKYSFKWSENDSLSAFMLEQAKKAVELLWKMESSKSTGERKAVLPEEERPAITCIQAPEEMKNEPPLPSSSNRPSNVVPLTPPAREVVTGFGLKPESRMQCIAFLFRNVLKAEFGKVDGVVLAKRGNLAFLQIPNHPRPIGD